MFKSNESFPNLEKKEYGKNVEILLKIIRHGDRDPKTNMLTEMGKQITAENAQASGLNADDFDLIHAIGSTVGPYDENNRGRAEATANIYAQQIAGDSSFNTRKTEVLAYDKFKSPIPYDHKEIYGSFLPPNFSELSDDEKVAAGIVAQGKLVEYVLNLNTPEAIKFKEESAGSLAYLINHYKAVIPRLQSGKNFFLPAGVHGPSMEFLLQKSLIRKDDNGQEVKGFNELTEIGGQHNVSEAFTLKFGTDENGDDTNISIQFDNPERPATTTMILDIEVVNELSQKFSELHPELHGLRERKQ